MNDQLEFEHTLHITEIMSRDACWIKVNNLDCFFLERSLRPINEALEE